MMPRWLHVLLQVSITFAQFAPRIWPHMISEGAHEIWHEALTMVQGTLGIAAQSYNTDGTPQAVGFTPKP